MTRPFRRREPQLEPVRGREELLAAIVAAQQEIAELELDLDAALTRLVERLQELTRADGAGIWQLEGDRLAIRGASGIATDPRLVRLSLAKSLAGACLRSGESSTTIDSTPAPGPAGSLILVPVRGDERPTAVLGVLYRARAGFDDEAVETARLMGQFASTTLRNAAELRARRDLAAALAESEERFRNAIESSPIGFALATPDDRYLTVNDAYCRIVGRSRAELERLTWRDVTHPDDLAAEIELTQGLIDGELPHLEIEKRFVRGDGSTVWVRTLVSLTRTREGEPYYGVAQVQDITERRLLEQSVRERERLFRAVFDQSMTAHVVFDDEGRLLDANQSAARLAGLPKEELLGRSWLEFAPPGDDFADVLAALHEHGKATGEREIVTADGQRRTVQFAGRANVQPGRHLSVIQDVTEQRRLEERLRQGQKMEAVGRLAGGIAHDFNNMLTAINGYSELLLGKLGEETQLHRHAFEIHQAGLRAASLTRQLLAFSRRQVLQPTVLDLNASIEQMRDMIQRLVGEDVRIEAALSAGADPVLADESQVQQVVVNLAANARDAMPQGGVLRIATETVTVDPEQARDAVATPGRYTRVTISDTGIGMDEEQLARLFEPFYSTKGEAGVGLGLATVYGVVRQSGGFLTVQSTPGRGSSFQVYLPVTGRRAVDVDEPGDEEEHEPAGETVLLVEDEEIVRVILTEMLEASGYRVLAADDGADALRVAEAEPGPIDVLVTDVVMPAMSGQEVARRIAERRPAVRTLFVSGYTESAIGNHGVLAPGTSFLQKPFSAADLTRTLRELLDAAPVG
ncbi:MAG TPA: PAS domain S-box protein [Gaiellaceae bacterium]|nr:PAS domain S-box protein [Gaiellaceae bacterium]